MGECGPVTEPVMGWELVVPVRQTGVCLRQTEAYFVPRSRSSVLYCPPACHADSQLFSTEM